MPDQDGGSQKVLSSSIGYSRVEIEDEGSNAEAKKNENFEIFVKIEFSLIFHEIYSKFRKKHAKLKKD